ncbi:MAG: hypothetical protein ACRDQW_16390 [Haloechinothrix sp.]
MTTPSAPSGIPLVDALTTKDPPKIEDYVAAASEYVRLSAKGRLTAGQKKAGQIRMSAFLGRVVLAELQARLPGIRHGHAGEATVSGALRSVKADVSEIHPLDGLRFAVEIKPVLLAVGRAVWNRFGDIRTFAVNLHLKFPFAVVGGVMPVPTYEEERGVRRDTTGLIQRLVSRLERAGGRKTEGDAPHLLEGIAVVVFDPDTATIHGDVPPRGSGLQWKEFLVAMAAAYESRFEVP